MNPYEPVKNTNEIIQPFSDQYGAKQQYPPNNQYQNDQYPGSFNPQNNQGYPPSNPYQGYPSNVIHNQGPFVQPQTNYAYYANPTNDNYAVIAPQLGPSICPFCKRQTEIISRKLPGAVTWIWFATLFFFGCCFCSCIPFCTDSCKDLHRICTACQRSIQIVPARCF